MDGEKSLLSVKNNMNNNNKEEEKYIDSDNDKGNEVKSSISSSITLKDWEKKENKNGEKIYKWITETINIYELTELGLIKSTKAEELGFKKDEIMEDENGNKYKIEELEIKDQSCCIIIGLKLALSFWCIADLYKYCYKNYLSLLKDFKKIQIDDKIHIDDLTDDHISILEDMISLSNVLLLINADNYTIWNFRKRLILNDCLSVINDLCIVNLTLSTHFKSKETWAHRKWLLENYNEQIDMIQEITICTRHAELRPKNYYCWTYRLLLIQYFNLEELKEELVRIQYWIKKHISDNCGFHHKKIVLMMMLKKIDLDLYQHMYSMLNSVKYYDYINSNSDNESIKMIDNILVDSYNDQIVINDVNKEIIGLLIEYINVIKREFMINNNVIQLYPGHESMWLYQRFLSYYWMVLNMVLVSKFPLEIFQTHFFDVCYNEKNSIDTIIEDNNDDFIEKRFYSPNLISEFNFGLYYKDRYLIIAKSKPRIICFPSSYLYWLYHINHLINQVIDSMKIKINNNNNQQKDHMINSLTLLEKILKPINEEESNDLIISFINELKSEKQENENIFIYHPLLRIVQ